MTKQLLHIEFYRSAFCPRCIQVRKILARLQTHYPFLVINEIDVLLHPVQSWNNKIRMIPALKTGKTILSAFTINESQLIDFIESSLTEDRDGDRGVKK